jgi:prepilin-type processing-associated H-X9-DG protein
MPQTDNLVFSHYTYNTMCLRNDQTHETSVPAGSEGLVVNGKTVQFSSMFANYTDTAATGYGVFPQEGPIPITKVVYPSDTWMACDSGGSEQGGPYGIAFDGAVFRHPGLSCNFLYFDGHCENLPSTAVDATTYSGAPNLSSAATTVIRDLRMFAIR